MSKPKRQVFDTPSPPPELTGNPPPFALNNTSFIDDNQSINSEITSFDHIKLPTKTRLTLFPYKNDHKRHIFFQEKYSIIMKQYSSLMFSIPASNGSFILSPSLTSNTPSASLKNVDIIEKNHFGFTQKKFDFKHYLNLTTNNLNKMQDYFKNENRIESLKIAIQTSRIMISQVVMQEPQFFPSIYVCVAKVLDKFSELVYNRLYNLASIKENGILSSQTIPPINGINDNNQNNNSNSNIKRRKKLNNSSNTPSQSADEGLLNKSFSRSQTHDSYDIDITNNNNNNINNGIVKLTNNDNDNDIDDMKQALPPNKQSFNDSDHDETNDDFNLNKYDIFYNTEINHKLPYNFSYTHCSNLCKIKTQNWFLKISAVRELVPRLLIEISLLRSLRFIYSLKDIANYLQLLVQRLRGISDPLISAYINIF